MWATRVQDQMHQKLSPAIQPTINTWNRGQLWARNGDPCKLIQAHGPRFQGRPPRNPEAGKHGEVFWFHPKPKHRQGVIKVLQIYDLTSDKAQVNGTVQAVCCWCSLLRYQRSHMNLGKRSNTFEKSNGHATFYHKRSAGQDQDIWHLYPDVVNLS